MKDSSDSATQPWVDPELIAAGAFLKEQGLVSPDPRNAPIVDVRVAQDVIGAALSKGVMPVKEERDITISGTRQVHCRFYRPESSTPLPLLIYFHGGGFAYGSARGWDGLMRELVHQSGVAILNVDYSLAPDFQFPAGLEDATAAIRHSIAHGRDWGVDLTRLAFGGDSAGANLALSAALGLNAEERRSLRFLLLFYGVFSGDSDSASWRTLGSGSYGLSQIQMEWVWSTYLSDQQQRKDWRATPLSGDLADLPGILQIIGTLDPLMDDAEALKRRLDEVGVRNHLSPYRGVNHGFIRFGSLLAKARAAVSEAAAALRAELGPSAGSGKS
jgi:acetyl esterase/lipase